MMDAAKHYTVTHDRTMPSAKPSTPNRRAEDKEEEEEEEEIK